MLFHGIQKAILPLWIMSEAREAIRIAESYVQKKRKNYLRYPIINATSEVGVQNSDVMVTSLFTYLWFLIINIFYFQSNFRFIEKLS